VTRIEFSLGERARVFLAIYEISGKLVRILVNETEPAGSHAAIWNGEDESGIHVASGVYVCRLDASGKTAMRKMVLLK
jgi:flagellar hook assembly protein FlgD